MENTMREQMDQVDALMTRTLQSADEQIKIYVDEQRRVCHLMSQFNFKLTFAERDTEYELSYTHGIIVQGEMQQSIYSVIM